MKPPAWTLALPLAAFAGDALAWGLQTHLFFAQHVLLLAPLADPEFRLAALRFPRLVLAGACLPDLSLAGRALGTTAFSRNHLWSTARRYCAAACDEERAVAVGYASHLLADVVAHNRFVPEHEARIADVSHATHALCEWAMDEHLRSAVFATPADLLDAERQSLGGIVARRSACTEDTASRAILFLARAEALLRRSRLPRLCRAVMRGLDHLLSPRLDAYARETALGLAPIGALLEGAAPEAEPEPLRRAANAAHARSVALALPPALS